MGSPYNDTAKLRDFASEQRLFISVILLTIEDSKKWGLRIKRERDRLPRTFRKKKGAPERRVLAFADRLVRIRQLLHEVRHPWFGEICDIVGVPHSRIVSKIEDHLSDAIAELKHPFWIHIFQGVPLNFCGLNRPDE